MARKFLYFIAGIAVLVIAGAFVLNIYANELTRYATVPDVEFVEQEALEESVYGNPAMWFSRPGMVDDPADFLPDDFARNGDAPAAAVFFIHPTSFFSKQAWNAPLEDASANSRAELFVRGLASPFNATDDLWVPRYRQATFGAFLTDKPEGDEALEAAYRDIEMAFDQFLAEIDATRPIVIAGHSQGALHAMTLLARRVKGTPVAERIAAAYIVGWPISLDHDLPELPLPACETAQSSACIISWSSYAEPADTSLTLEAYAASPGLDGTLRGTSPFLCTNPLTGTLNGEAPASSNRGTLLPNAELTQAELVIEAVPARCGEEGFLYIGDPPEVGQGVLPGNNYHVYDIPLFWLNLREDFARRVAAFGG
jgi:hypothetical protein